jgi:hypothetical protein
MPSANEFSLTPAANVTIGGVNVGEDCSPGGLNDALRYVAAVCRDTSDKIPVVGGFVPSTGGSYTGDIFRATRGAYLHHAGAGQTDGRVMFLPEGSARPGGSEGLVVFYYS